jgi:tRNA (guanine37-N1)-methyltransferase
MLTNYAISKKKDANKVKQQLIDEGIYDKEYRAENDSKAVYFPITNIKRAKELGFSIEKKDTRTYKARTKSLKEILNEDFNLKEDIISSFDTIGDIAILKITPEMEKDEKEIAKEMLRHNKNLKTIVKKVKEHHGIYRVQSVEWLAGEKTLTTLVKEAGATFKIEVGKMFFSPRLSHERLRISKLIKPNTNVAVFFSGVGPFSIIIAKKQPLVNKVYSIELNPDANKAALENIKLNKVDEKVEAVCADVNEFSDKIEDWADYVIMPLPKTSNLFLESAYKAMKKGKKSGIISLYKFVDKINPYTETIKELEDFAKSKDKKLEIMFKREVRDFSPQVIQIVIDFRLNN